MLNLDNFRRRVWAPAVEAAGVAKPARLYDMRSTFASESIAAGIGADELARVMGTSVAMIEEHYGVLLDGAGAAIAARLDAYDAEQVAARRLRGIAPLRPFAPGLPRYHAPRFARQSPETPVRY